MLENKNQWLGQIYNKKNIQDCISKIKERYGQQFSESKSIREQHSHTMTIHESELPDGVLFASNKNDVSEAVKICNEFGCPIIPFGVGSSFEGHVNAPFGGLSID